LFLLKEIIRKTFNLIQKDKLISERGWDPVTGISVEVKE